MSTSTSLPVSAVALDVHPLLSERWSTRAFDPDHVLEAETAGRLLEAARWSPSASNTQPWRFAVALRGTPEHDVLFGTLMGFNQAWAGNASALVLVAAERVTPEGKTLRWADLDAGQAVAHLTVQAAAEGLVVHTLGGIEVDAIRAAYEIPDGVEPLVVVAVGRQGDLETLDETVRARELTRARRPLSELLLPLRGASA
ncbi:nitroreductase family protein [Quadrisphaera granulorum]|uniref:nitroreductase family protein n=1 Tax=Quadrisphaera granulorum TaxID=317664 RepID=UPI000D6CB931|nr:nitroreductase family protein [Quadrisphaera granulorum]